MSPETAARPPTAPPVRPPSAHDHRPRTRTVHANGIDIAYESFGDEADPPIVMVMGLGTQMVGWPVPLCEALARAGHRVIRFDNRDVGESSHLDHLPAPDPLAVALRRAEAPYSIHDMAADLIGLLDALDIERAHLVGASMGGFISQTAALANPERFRTLTLFMTSTGSRLVGQPELRVLWRLSRRRTARDRHSVVSAAVDTFRLIGSQGYAFDEEYLRGLAGLSYERGFNPPGYLRHVAASVTQHNRTRALRRLRVPTLVIHGLHDPLVRPSGGLAIARAVPRAKFVGFSGMGHDLPRALWPAFETEIVDHVAAPALGER